MQIYDHSPRLIVMDIRAFLLSNKTTKGLKRASDDSAGGSTSTCKSSSKRKFVQTWLRDLLWLTYNVEANQMFCKLCRDNTACSVTHPLPSYLAVRTFARIFDIFLILCCTEVPRLVETRLWLVKPEHVLAIWLLSSKVKFEPCCLLRDFLIPKP